MTIKKIAHQLIRLCQSGQFEKAYNTLFADNAISIEPDGIITDGLSAILKKSESFKTDIEFVSCTFERPQFAGNYFSMIQTYHSLIRKTSEKKKMQEIVVYKVENEQIVEERFFY